MNDVKVDKFKAASIQLEAALELYFSERHLPAVFTLGCASLELLESTSHLYGISEYTFDSWLKEKFSSDHKLARKHILKAKNFLKHADRDPFEHIDVEIKHVELILMFAVLQTTMRISVSSHGLDGYKSIFMMYMGWYAAGLEDSIVLNEMVAPLATRLSISPPEEPLEITPKTYYDWMLKWNSLLIDNADKMVELIEGALKDSGLYEQLLELQSMLEKENCITP